MSSMESHIFPIVFIGAVKSSNAPVEMTIGRAAQIELMVINLHEMKSAARRDLDATWMLRSSVSTRRPRDDCRKLVLQVQVD